MTIRTHQKTWGVAANAIIALAILLAAGPAWAKTISNSPDQFVIDGAKPYVYLKFDHIGKRESAVEGEGSEGLWLRLVNNCNLPITVLTNDLGAAGHGVAVPYSVVPVPGFLGPSEEQLKSMPHGYTTDVGTSVIILPGRTLLFSIPLDRVMPQWYVQVRFEFALPRPKEGYNPYSLVDFTWEDMPERYQSAPAN